ncbi:uncharacterized protein LOC130957441 [Arachis stenosperma]|uniref:uncharacterized protein LOC130957441 n=1 Tax=Arachis stenosperma TaxID=217475 RepID=UPI0025ACD64F|nr:uncharacterized protein LOC130957441 [Arachis stenosperma]
MVKEMYIYRIAELEEELFAIKQGELFITGYYTMLKAIWKKLDNLRPIPTCSRCIGSCNCEFSIIRAYKEESNVVRLLRGLNEQFSTIRSQIILMTPLPKVNMVFSSLLQQERQIHMNDIIDGKTLLFSSKNDRIENLSTAPRGRDRNRRGIGAFGRNRRGTKQCSYCGKSDHMADTCYKKYGYHPRYKSNGSSINNVVVEEADAENSHPNQKKHDAKPGFNLSSEQKEALLAFLTQQDSQSKHNLN